MQDIVTAKEIAQALGITRQACGIRASKESWPFEEVACRGGKRRLYPVRSLPEDVRQAFAAAMLAGDPGPGTPPAVAAGTLPATEAPAALPRSLAQLTKRQRETALARLAFVREIERAVPLIGKEKAIRNLVKAAKDSALAAHLAEQVAVANDRMTAGRGLSRRRLYDWCRMFAEGGEAALAPKHQGKDMSVPDWAPAFLAIWQRPQKPTVTDAYDEFKAGYAGQIPSIFAVRRWLDKMAMPSREAGRRTGNALIKLRPHKHRKTGELWPGDIYTADGTTFDAEIQHPIRKRVPDRIIEDVITFHERYRCLLWVVEAVQFQEFLRTELIRRAMLRGLAIPARAVTPITDKALRIEALQPYFAQGRIRLHPSQRTLIEQLTHFPKADHDDGPDALEMLFQAATRGFAAMAFTRVPKAGGRNLVGKGRHDHDDDDD